MVPRTMFAALAVILAAGPAGAAGYVEAGRLAAQEWCANCHVVAGTGGQDAARPLRAIANDPATTASALTVFLVEPHGDMPNFHLSRRDIDDLVAYILSLREAPKGSP